MPHFFRMSINLKKSQELSRFWYGIGFYWKINWWRRRESNPRPQILRLWQTTCLAKSLILTIYYPTSRTVKQRVRLKFNNAIWTNCVTSLCNMTIGSKRISTFRQWYCQLFTQLRQQVHSRHLQLYLMQSNFNELDYILDMRLKFCNLRRSRSPP